MTRKMIVNALDPEEVRIAIVNRQGLLEEFDIETRGVEKNKGNIYKAVVMAVEPALNAAFVDYGAEKQGFLTANDVDPKYSGKKLDPEKHFRIDELLRPKQEILVQVEKDEVGSKGAVLTTYLSLAGRYTVLMPGSSRQGVSRKIEDDDTRRRMKEAAAMLDVPDEMGVIIRTAGRDRTKTELNRDLKVLLRLWENIQKEAGRAKGAALILKEQDVIIRALRDYFSNDIVEIVLDTDDAFDRAAEYAHLVMPKQRSVLTRYVERRPIFHHYRIEDQLEVLYSRKVALPNGGSVVIEPTEALVAIDVNSGKQKQRDQEATALQTNIDAAKEVARQLRLRDLGGIIVVDFIDMFVRKHQLQVERVMKEALKLDKARVKVGRISPNGTLELTRQRIRSALGASIFRACPTCQGTGHILNPQSHAVAVLRKLRDRTSRGDLLAAKVHIEPEAGNILRTEKWSAVHEIEQRHNIRVDIVPDKSMVPGQVDFTFETNPNAVVLPEPEPDFGPPELPEGYEPEPEEEAEEMPLLATLAAEEAAAEREEGEEAEEERGRRKRRRRRGKGEGAVAAKAPGLPKCTLPVVGEWDLPAFELFDLALLGLDRAPARAEEAEEAPGEERAGRGRRRRRGRGAKEGPAPIAELEEVSAAEILAGAPPSPPVSVSAPAAKPAPAVAAGPAATNGAETEEEGKQRKKKSLLARLFGRKEDAEENVEP